MTGKLLPSGTVWVQRPVPDVAHDLCATGIPARLANLLACRGVATRQEADEFLAPALDQLHEPTALPGVCEAVTRLQQAHDEGSKVAVVGDYDVDGISATALLSAVMTACGLSVESILPNRLTEGYGIQVAHVERAAELGCQVIVTADCGSTATEAATAAGERGMDLIVTDHHLGGGQLPAGVIEINPRNGKGSYPFAELSGAGVAYKLAAALSIAFGRPVPHNSMLRVACLGTICDLVPLRGENRVIASLGLQELPQTHSPGLRALIEVAGVKRDLSATDVGFRLGPRLNAAGRLGDPGVALRLLLSREPLEARQLASELDELNRLRQKSEAEVLEEARSRLLERAELPKIITLWDQNWHKGVVGIVAGRLVREFHRPTLLLSLDGDSATGSGRSIAGVDLHSFLSRYSHRLSRFGGHAQAVGLTVAAADLEVLAEELQRGAEDWESGTLIPRLEYELDLAPGEVNDTLRLELARLAPFGMGNRQPIARVGPLELAGEPRRFGKGHLAARAIGNDGSEVELLGWGWQAQEDLLAGAFEALGAIEEDTFNGSTVLRLKAARPWSVDGAGGNRMTGHGEEA